jgi:hypothetical protein
VAGAVDLPDAELIAEVQQYLEEKNPCSGIKLPQAGMAVTSSLNLALGLIGFVRQVLQEFKEIWRLANEEPIFR